MMACRPGTWARFVRGSRERDIQRTAGYGLDPLRRQRLRKFERPEKIIPVRNCKRGLAVRRCQLGQRLDWKSAFQKRVGRVHVKMNKAWLFHAIPRTAREANLPDSLKLS